ncbi:MAG: hypothetical protein AAF357_08720, partial [Verrucomicrobiota bacterium]
EFHYFSMRDLMTGPKSFDWSSIDEKLVVTQSRGCQLVFRVIAEFPGRPRQVPDFIVEQGVEITLWTDPDGNESHTPDYEHPTMRLALVDFIEALGSQYDGDPRVGYITAGLLGSWGEWHTHPREDLWASRETQRLVLKAFERTIEKTPVLLRYPAGEGSVSQSENVSLNFGYHDDSFNWATLETGNPEDSWFFIPLLKNAGALEKWKTAPIGGEVRPELWDKSFTDNPHPRAQGFFDCVEATHATWLMDTGLFSKRFPLSNERKAKAIKAAQTLGYEFFVSSCERAGEQLRLTVENTGVAPFYADWPVELSNGDQVVKRFSLQGILPGEVKVWEAEIKARVLFGFVCRIPWRVGGPFALPMRIKKEGG